LKFHAKYVCTQDLIMCFKRNIDKNYVVLKRFATLGNWVYFSLRHVNSIRLDNTAKILFQVSPEASLLLYDWQKRKFICMFASQLREEYYLIHAILKRRGCESHFNIPTGVAWNIYKIKLFKYMIKPTRTRVLIPKFMKIVYKTWVDEK
jgi:hypothetical protein